MMRGAGEGGRYFALKSISKERLRCAGCREALHVRREKEALLAVQPHPFIVTLHATFQDRTTLYLLLSLGLGGDLRGMILRYQRHQTPMDDETSAFYIAVLVLVLDHLHSCGYAYRDLKPENVLIDSEGFALLCDFGTAVHLGSTGRSMTIVGTWEYAAPEQLKEQGSTMASDWWALGVILFECLSGEQPFPSGDDDDPLEVLDAIYQFGQARVSPSWERDVGATRACTSMGRTDQATANPDTNNLAMDDPAMISAEGLASDSAPANSHETGKILKQLDRLSVPARNLVNALLQEDEFTRWKGTRRPQLHASRFFADVDWQALSSRDVVPPFKPNLLGNADTRNFAHCSTGETILDTMIGAPLEADAVESSSASEGDRVLTSATTVIVDEPAKRPCRRASSRPSSWSDF